jgi:hypothetical protein
MLTRMQELAQRGARLLDEHGPHDWANRVNLRTLDQGSAEWCVMAQVLGGYEPGWVTRHTGFDWIEGLLSQVWYGFSLTDNGEYLYPVLTEAWKTEIEKRRAPGITRLSERL